MDQPTGAVRSDFDLAAQTCGHDTLTVTGAENARHDSRVWDLLEQIDATVIEATAFIRQVRADAEDQQIREHIRSARKAIARSRTVRP